MSQDTSSSGLSANVETFSGLVRSFPTHGGWHYIEVPEPVVDLFRSTTVGRRELWGVMPILATIGATSWRTSLMRSRSPAFHFLPINKSVRLDENIGEGMVVGVTLIAR